MNDDKWSEREQYQARMTVWMASFDFVYKLARLAVVSLGIVVSGSVLYSWRGLTTVAYVDFPFVGAIVTVGTDITEAIGQLGSPLLWVMLGAAVVFGLFQKTQRERKTQYLSSRVQQLELVIDEDRSSSQLESTGQTRKEDREL